MQSIIWPWDNKRWPDTKNKINEDIKSIVDMDSRVAAVSKGKIKPRLVIDLFNTYYTEDVYSKDRIPQDVMVGKVFPMLQKLISDAPKTFKGFKPRVLLPHHTTNLVLNRVQVATILACTWFNLFDYQYLTRGKYKLDDMPELSFAKMYANKNMFMFQCIINYFARVYAYLHVGDADSVNLFRAGNIILYRKTILNKDLPDWTNSEKPIMETMLGDGPIEEAETREQVAFTSEILCVDNFGGNLTPDEITFLIRPECLVSLLFCTKLEANETISILGAEQMSSYTGFGSMIKYSGNYVDATPKGYSADNTEVMTQNIVIALDATTDTSGIGQFVKDFNRDLNKAYCGFSTFKFSKNVEKIATGNWGCGVYGGNPSLKYVQQLLAASQAGKILVYHCNNKVFEDKLEHFIYWLSQRDFTVGKLYKTYLQVIQNCATGPHARLSELDIFESIMDVGDDE